MLGSLEVSVHVSPRLARQLGPLPVEIDILSVDEPKPAVELDLLERIAGSNGIDAIVHLYGIKSTLRAWLGRRPLPKPAVVLIHQASALHYPKSYGTPLSLLETANAWYKEILVWRWRRRADALGVLALDAPAVTRWSPRNGAPVYLLPDAPVEAVDHSVGSHRAGCILFGAISARKGVQLLTDAVEVRPHPPAVTLAGKVHSNFQETFDHCVSRMRKAGSTVRVHNGWLSDEEVTHLLSTSACVVLPYIRHKGTSRVLVEAAAAGTPVVAHDSGMLGSLVREHALGLTADCTDPIEFRNAIDALVDDGHAAAGHSESLSRFAARSSSDAFRDAVLAPFRNGRPPGA